MEYGKEGYAIITLLVILMFCTEKSESSDSTQSNRSSRPNPMKNPEFSTIPKDVRPFYVKTKSRLMKLGVITQEAFSELKKKFQ